MEVADKVSGMAKRTAELESLLSSSELVESGNTGHLKKGRYHTAPNDAN